MISEKQIKKIREKIINCRNPVILYDDDADGICSFLLIKKYLKKHNIDPKGIIVKSSPEIKAKQYSRKVSNYYPDLVIILDKPLIEDEFLDDVKCEKIWIDHHAIPDNSERDDINYYNPLQNSKINYPTTLQCWCVVEDNKEIKNNNLWVAVTGCAGDWFYPENLLTKFKEKYPDYIEDNIKTAPGIMFDSRLSIIIKTIFFMTKGRVNDVYKIITRLEKIEHPDEILLQNTENGDKLYQRYKKINEIYEKLMKKAIKNKDKTEFLVAIIPQEKYSFSSELSNEIFYRYPDKIIIVGRISEGYVKGSIRTSFNIDLPEIIQSSLNGFDGTGGGHKNACGFKIKETDFNDFLDIFKKETKNKFDH
ncbi:MAG: DHHA1 domain-containing protein [Nanobdellota archaeon]